MRCRRAPRRARLRHRFRCVRHRLGDRPQDLQQRDLGRPGHGAPLPTILELAKDAGFKTGNVTTAELTDATPAVLDSHVSLRGCQGPADMATCPTETKEAGGLGSIAEQTVDHRRRRVDGRRQGPLRSDGHRWSVRRSDRRRSRLRHSATQSPPIRPASTPPQPGTKFLGLFHPSNMDLEWTGPLAAPYPGPAATACTESNPHRPPPSRTSPT